MTDVRDYGAAGDLRKRVKPGGRVRLPAGVWTLDAAGTNGLSLDGLRLSGDGPGLTVLRWSGKPADGTLLTLLHGKAALESLSIEGPLAKHGAYEDAKINCVATYPGTSLVLRDVEVTGGYFGLHTAGGLDAADCSIQSRTGVLATGAGLCRVQRSEVWGCGTGRAAKPALLNQCHDLYVNPGVDLDLAYVTCRDYAPGGKGYAVVVYGPCERPASVCRLVCVDVDESHWLGVRRHPSIKTQDWGCSVRSRSDAATGGFH